MQPFVDPGRLGEVASLLAEGLRDFPSFRVTLKTFRIFEFDTAPKKSKAKILYLDPACDPPDALEALYARLVELMPHYASKASSWIPHLGLGTLRKPKTDVEAILEAYQAGWDPVTFEVTHLSLNGRDAKDPTVDFETLVEIPLGPFPQSLKK
jgi:2'-5' RNA ligase